MAKVNLGTVANILGNPVSAATTINNNSALLIAAIENTLSRDGTNPNQMEADLDLNHNDLLNVRTLVVGDITVDGDNVTGILERAEGAADEAEASADSAEADRILAQIARDEAVEAAGEVQLALNNWISNQFVGDGTSTTFLLTNNPGTKLNMHVYVDGVKQHTDTYELTFAGDDPQIEFSEAPPLDLPFEIMMGTSVEFEIGTVTDGAITASKIADGAVTAPKIGDNTIPVAKLLNSEASTLGKSLLAATTVPAAAVILKNKWEWIEDRSFSGITTTGVQFLNLAPFSRLRLSGHFSIVSAAQMYFHVSVDNGATWISAASDYVSQLNTYSSTTDTHVRTTVSAGVCSPTVSAGSNNVIDLELYLFNTAGTGRFKCETVGVGDSISYYTADSGGVMSVSGSYNAFRLLTGGSVATTGVVTLEGIR